MGRFASHWIYLLGSVLISMGSTPSIAATEPASWGIAPYGGQNDTRGARLGDRDIADEVRKVIGTDPVLSNDKLNVNVKDGVVSVSGTVENLAHQRKIFEDGLVEGAKGIDLTQLHLMPATPEENQTRIWPKKLLSRNMTEEIRNQINDDSRVADEPVHVGVSNFVPVLTGEVDSLEAKRAAEEDARRATGVPIVDDELKVAPESSAALDRHSMVSRNLKTKRTGK